jgi:CheY-like chemotaxis protein
MNRLRHVLLAEDDENDVFFMLRAFREVGLPNPIHVARDGQDAIEYLAGDGRYQDRKAFPFPALAILDLKMPRKSGMEVLSWLRRQPLLSALPVMILSSSVNQYDVERAYQLWVNAFLSKPIDTEKRVELTAIIKDFWLNLNQLPAVCVEGLEGAKRLRAEPGFLRFLPET